MFLNNLLLKARVFLDQTEAASAIEYVLIVTMVALVVATFVTPIGGVVKSTLNSVLTALGGTAI